MQKKVHIWQYVLLIIIMSCSSSDNSEDDNNVNPTPSVSAVQIKDVNNLGDGRDIEISFNKVADESLISEYRIFIVKSENANGFNLQLAENLAQEFYTKVNKSGGNITITLTAATKDVDGDPIEPDRLYKAFVLTIGSANSTGENNLSSGSASLAIQIPEIEAVANITASDVANNGNARDIEVAFFKLIDESLISGYKVILVKETQVSTFDLSQATMLGAESYFFSEKNGVSKRFELPPNLLDSDGEAISENIAYTIVVISEPDEISGERKMAVSDEVLILEQKNAIRTLAILENAGTGGMQVDNLGNIYMGNFGLNDNGGGTNLYKITPGGQTSVFANGFNTADGNDIDSAGNFYQVSYSENTIYKISPDGSSKTVFAAGNLLNGPIGIAIDTDDDLYVTNYNNNLVIKITKGGIMSLYASSGLFNGANGLDFDSSGNLYVSNWNTNQIVKLDKDTGSPSLFALTPSTRNAHLVIQDDMIYVAGRSNHKIFRITLAGEVSDFIGTGTKGDSNGILENAKICWPNDMAFNQDGSKMYISMVSPTAPSSNILSPAIIKEVSIVE